MKVRSLFISDCHIGSQHCQHEKLLNLISNVECEYLYLVGDIIDGWALQKRIKWEKNYNVFFQKVLRLSRKGTIINYCVGNHDAFLNSFCGSSFGGINIVKEVVHSSLSGKEFLVVHGDQFDGLIANAKWIQKIGSIIYDFSLIANKILTIFKFSLSNFLKQKAKSAVKYIANYENAVIEYCKKYSYDGIICGHLHCPVIKKIEDVEYLNIGDFTENNTAIVEELDGEIRLIHL